MFKILRKSDVCQNFFRKIQIAMVSTYGGILQEQTFYDTNKNISKPDTHQSFQARNFSFSSQDKKDTFLSYLPEVINTALKFDGPNTYPGFSQYVETMLKYNLINGKHYRGLITVEFYKALEKLENQTEDNLKLANLMGWCVEMAYYLMTDDIIDGSTFRRGVPCWYRNEGVGLMAINDSLFMKLGIYSILNKFFSNHHCYLRAMETFHKISLKTTIGQMLDGTYNATTEHGLKFFNVRNYNQLSKYKTAYYTFVLPATVGMYIANEYDTQIHGQVSDIALDLGIFYQSRDDFLDVFGTSDKTGKVGTDICEGKCTWLAVTALEKANATQRTLMEECYGQNNPEDIAKIQNLYNELNLREVFAAHEKQQYDRIVSKIELALDKVPKDSFMNILHTIYKREG